MKCGNLKNSGKKMLDVLEQERSQQDKALLDGR